MATIEKRESGYRVKVRKLGVSKNATFRTKAEATAWAAVTEAEIISSARGDIPNKTFGQLLDRYIDDIIPAKRGARPDTLRMRRVQNDKELAGVALADLDARHISAWRDRRLKEVSAASVRREWSTLSHACNIAVKEWRWLRENPFSGVEKPAAHKPRQRRYGKSDIDGILLATGYEYDALPETAMARVGAAMLFAIESAMRASEICGLSEKTVDEKRRVAHLPLTKNGRARDVPLSKEALRLIRQVREVTQRPGAEEGQPLFGLTPAILDALFRKAKKRAMLEDLHFHDTRREALTRLAKKVDVMTLAKISGHMDLRILQNTYYEPDIAEVADLLD
jgi:integrase